MRHLGLITLSAAILSLGLTLGTAPHPAEAGKACKRAGLPNFCAKSSDIFPNITLGKRGNDGDLRLKRNNGTNGIMLDGNSGNVTNRFSNAAGSSNGLIKAWAAINADGTIAACWRCNTDPAQTRRTGLGAYEVDFTPLTTDIRGRPIIGGTGSSGFAEGSLSTGDNSSMSILTRSTTGVLSDLSFVLVII